MTAKSAAPTGDSPTAETPIEVQGGAGEDTSGTAARQNLLLDRMLYKGALPRYAFPTDVAAFYVFDENQSAYNRPAFRFSPSQGLAIALTQYAPGKEVWIANKRFRSGAVYSPYREERYGAWHSRRLYLECKNCHFAATRSVDVAHKGEVDDCPACGQIGAFGPARFWFRPPGFAHPVSWLENVSPDEQPARSYATRAKLEAPSPETGKAGWVRVSDRSRVHYLRQQLLVTNTGPRQEGYSYCTMCGRIEPTAGDVGELTHPHKKPYPDQREPICQTPRVSSGIVLGTDFYTDILLVSMHVDDPVRLTPGALAAEIALRTASEAIAKAAGLVLQLEPGELQADFRAALTSGGQSGVEAEIFLYDTLPGGAGFARLAGERASEVLRKACDILSDCDCDTSCYKCLRSFKNKFEHDRLDRRAGRDLLRLVLDGTRPVVDPERLVRAVALLAEDIGRQADGALIVSVNRTIDVTGIGSVLVPILVSAPDGRRVAVSVTHPLTPTTPADDAMHELAEFSLIPPVFANELKIRRNLPSVTREVLRLFGLDS